MNVSVVARHMDVTDGMKEYALDKANRLEKFYDGLTSISVTLDKEAGQFLVEIVAMGRRKSTFVAHHRDPDLHACYDQCVHKVAEQLRRHKDRVRDRHGPGHDQTMVIQETDETDETDGAAQE